MRNPCYSSTFFWTPGEEKVIEDYLSKTSLSLSEIAREVSKQNSERSHKAISQRVRIIAKRMDVVDRRGYLKSKKDASTATPHVVVHTKKSPDKPVEQGITVPEGFKFTGTPKKVILFNDRFEVYF